MGTQHTFEKALVTASSQAGREVQPEEDVTRWGITAKGMEYLVRWRREQAEKAAQEAKMARESMLNRTRPFSLMKT